MCGATYGCGSSAHQLGGIQNGGIFRKQEVQLEEGEPLKGIHGVQHVVAAFDQSCSAGGTIKMRDINTVLRPWGPGTGAFHGERVSAAQGQQEDGTRRGMEDDFNQVDVTEIEQVSVDLCQSFRKRKRKQENDKIYRMNCDPSASAKVGDTEKNRGSALKNSGNLSNLTGFRPNNEKKTDLVFSRLASEAKNRPGSDAYELEGAAADAAFKLHQGRMGDLPCICSERGRSKDDSMAEVELPKQQLENHKLRSEVAALKATLDHLLTFAEQGSK